MSMRVRVVEDNEMLADLWLRLLELEDFDVVVTRSGFAELLLPEPWDGIDAAIVDLMLGEPTTGADVLSYLVKTFPEIRRVVVSAAPYKDAGLAHVSLLKPTSVHDVVKALRGTDDL